METSRNRARTVARISVFSFALGGLGALVAADVVAAEAQETAELGVAQLQSDGEAFDDLEDPIRIAHHIAVPEVQPPPPPAAWYLAELEELARKQRKLRFGKMDAY